MHQPKAKETIAYPGFKTNTAGDTELKTTLATTVNQKTLTFSF